jgi:predicted fused transcriptional regulator/phosphomethylpyrimidine kinase/predicted transcriptional regulator
MRFPQEVVVHRVLPTYRALLARALDERGLAQEAIADHVGVTQAQVSKYLAGKVDLEPRIEEDPRVRGTVREVAEGLADGELDPVTALARSLELLRRLENRGPVCELHEEAMPELEGTGCDACLDPTSRVLDEHRAVVSVRTALRRLAMLDGLASWIPHVGTNLAEAVEGAEGLWDVAALPGRVDTVGGRVRFDTEPRLGASKHVATLVLAVMDEHPDLRAAVNLACREPLLDAARDAGLRVAGFDPSYEGRRAEVSRRVRDLDRPPGVLYHEGAFGIEPVAYVLGEDAGHVAERVEALVAGA